MPVTQTLKINPNLFGLPYQFPSTVDPRVEGVSQTLGRKFAENIGTEAPVCTFIPGVPSYLSNNPIKNRNKVNSTIALLTGNGYFGNSSFFKETTFDDMRLYDFKNDYTDYIKYVNVLCRAGAIFLELGDIELNGTKLREFNWKNFRWTGGGKNLSISGSTSQSKTDAFNMETKKVSEGGLDEILTNKNFVQFYVDADVSASDSFGNTTSESMLKSAMDSGSSYMKELAFLVDSGVGNDFSSFVESSTTSLTTGIETILGTGTLQNGISRLINSTSETLKGNNIIMPDVYQSSSYTKNYSLTIHLKTPYGNKLGYYLNIFVPMMHALALGLPRQASANSYESPFIIKAYVDGIFSCNMGIVQGISISKAAETWSVEGLPSEVDITMDIVDLYSGIQMTDSSSPMLFVTNSSLVEFLAVNCGLSLISPNITKKYQLVANAFTSSILDIPTNVTSRIQESIMTKVNNLLKLYN